MNVGTSSTPRIHIGIGGWTFEPWRGSFYPTGLAHSQELHYASRQLSAIEVNGTYYSTFKPPTFAKWHAETPEGFTFSLKANRFATHRRVLADAGPSITRFIESGITELKEKLGPIVWQFMPTKAFEPADFEAFLAQLPSEVDGRRLRHALDVRHESFATADFLSLARRYGCTPVCTDSEKFPAIADGAADFAYLRLMRGQAEVPTGYTPEAIARWAEGVRAWTSGERPRDVFVYLINGAKERAPAGALALMAQLGLRAQPPRPPQMARARPSRHGGGPSRPPAATSTSAWAEPAPNQAAPWHGFNGCGRNGGRPPDPAQ